MEELYPTLYDNKKVANILYSLFSPIKNNFNVMGKWESIDHYTTSKKEPEVRASELRIKTIDKVI
jgi:hypothetical protein